MFPPLALTGRLSRSNTVGELLSVGELPGFVAGMVGPGSDGTVSLLSMPAICYLAQMAQTVRPALLAEPFTLTSYPVGAPVTGTGAALDQGS